MGKNEGEVATRQLKCQAANLNVPRKSACGSCDVLLTLDGMPEALSGTEPPFDATRVHQVYDTTSSLGCHTVVGGVLDAAPLRDRQATGAIAGRITHRRWAVRQE